MRAHASTSCRTWTVMSYHSWLLQTSAQRRLFLRACECSQRRFLQCSFACNGTEKDCCAGRAAAGMQRSHSLNTAAWESRTDKESDDTSWHLQVSEQNGKTAMPTPPSPSKAVKLCEARNYAATRRRAFRARAHSAMTAPLVADTTLPSTCVKVETPSCWTGHVPSEGTAHTGGRSALSI